MPGFIDVHTHTDLAPFVPHGLYPKILQGVTTEICGQCGLSAAPVPAELQSRWRERMVIGDCPGEWRWENFSRYLEQLQKAKPDCNMVPFVGHGTLRWAAGGRGGPLSAVQLDRLRGLIRDSLHGGAAGVSLGLIYYPALFADRSELELVLSEAGRAGVPCSVHLRSESDELDTALQEMITIAGYSGCRLHHSHLKAIGAGNRFRLERVLELLEKHGLSFDSYPYTSGSTTLASLLPPELMSNGLDTALEQLRDPVRLQALEALYNGSGKKVGGQAWDNLPLLLGWHNIKVDLADTPELFSNLQQPGPVDLYTLAELLRVRPVELLVDLLKAGGTALRMIDRFMDEETLEKVLIHPAGMTGSDTLLGGRLHPRVYGTFARLFGRYVFEKELLSITEGVARTSTRAADRFALHGRGRLKPGYYADITVFDKGFVDRNSYADPEVPPSGVRAVFVNGVQRVERGRICGEPSGEVLHTTVSRSISGGSP